MLSFASLSVRPYFLAIFENNLLPLGFEALRPALKALILCLLPGLEDEQNEDFLTIFQALDKLRHDPSLTRDDDEDDGEEDEVQLSYFWQCFFLATITSPSRRQGALAYLNRKLPKFGTLAAAGGSLTLEAKAAVSPEPGLLVRCMAVGLSDKQLLVQRGFLDLLVTNIPLDCQVLQRAVSQQDLQLLTAAATGVVLRRDMSLNRRLWTWLLGPEPKAESEPNAENSIKSPQLDASAYHAAYFSRFGLNPLTRSIMGMITKVTTSPSERARPFRTCLSLMDRWEVGGLLIPDVFIPAIKSAYDFSKATNKPDGDEVVKSASIFFDGVEPGLIWAKFIQLVIEALTPNSDTATEKMGLCAFMVKRFNLTDEEMLGTHIPMAILTMFLCIETSSKTIDENDNTSNEMVAFETIEKLVGLLSEQSFSPKRGPPDDKSVTPSRIGADEDELLRPIIKFYTEDQGSLENAKAPFVPATVGHLLVKYSILILARLLKRKGSPDQVEAASRISCALMQKVSNISEILEAIDFSSTIERISSHDASEVVDFAKLSAIVQVLATIQVVTTEQPYFSASQLASLQHKLVNHLWPHLSPYQPKYHVEAVRALWLLGSASSPRIVEGFISSLMVHAMEPTADRKKGVAADAGRHFAVLWTHSVQERTLHADKSQRALLRRASGMSLQGDTQGDAQPDPSLLLTRPLLLLLDTLADEGTELSSFVRNWLHELPALSKVFDNLMNRIRILKCFEAATDSKCHQSLFKAGQESGTEDSSECIYYLRHILLILQNASEHTWLTLAAETTTPLSGDTDEESSSNILQTVLAQICMRCLEVQVVDGQDSGEVNTLQRVALMILQLLIAGPFSGPLKELEIDNFLLQKLRKTIPAFNPLQQVALLETVTAALKLRIYMTETAPLPSPSGNQARDGSRTQLSLSKDTGSEIPPQSTVSPLLMECLKAGFSSPSSHIIIDSWVSFLIEVLPLFAETIFQALIPLVECFCNQIQAVFDHLQTNFKHMPATTEADPEPTLISLINGLEQILARAHERLVTEEGRAAASRSPVVPQSFFNNVIQGVLTNETNQPTRNSTANTRLTVLLCFQDAVRTCFKVWCWGLYGTGHGIQDGSSIASFGYTSLRMRNRARRLLERLFAAESLESLETLIALWSRPPTEDFQPTSVLGLLNVLTGSRPKHTIPAIFHAIYSRTNPSGIDPARVSTKTSDLTDRELISFLVDYTGSIDDDAMDEIWSDCMAFMKDVLGNPLPHRQILPSLLEFVALLAVKVDQTTLGEQKKMRRELGVCLIFDATLFPN